MELLGFPYEFMYAHMHGTQPHAHAHTYRVAEYDLEPLILLCPCPPTWDYRHVPPHWPVCSTENPTQDLVNIPSSKVGNVKYKVGRVLMKRQQRHPQRCVWRPISQLILGPVKLKSSHHNQPTMAITMNIHCPLLPDVAGGPAASPDGL